ncbi:MAG: DNA-packaging protein [bacterium]|nr:DNA-packaging protein [bacterium]
MTDFKLNDAQLKANGTVFISGAENVLLKGGSRSSKTFLIIRNIILRSQKAPKSRHVVLRFRFTDCKSSIVFDTFPKVMELAYPGLKYHINKSDWFATFENGSEIWFGGLDDKERLEKILGKEYATSFINECSQVSNDARQMVSTRIAQKVYCKIKGAEDKLLPCREYFDYNPPSKAHWGYKLFEQHVDPETKQPLKDPENWVSMQLNPVDNEENLNPKYLKKLENMSPRYKKRFWYGDYSDDNPNQLVSDVTIDTYRIMDGAELPEMLRIVIPVDPSGSDDVDNITNDEIGIVPVGLGIDGHAYVLEDVTVKAGPAKWGNVATTAYDRLEADCVVGETNYGGAMVKFVIQTAKPDVPYKEVRASRGKHVRFEPVASLYNQGRIHHVGHFDKLEDEIQGMSTMGYLGDDSPNRVDSLAWGITELFPGLVTEPEEAEEDFYDVPESWEAA